MEVSPGKIGDPQLSRLLDDFSFILMNEGWAGQPHGPMLSTTDAGKTGCVHEHGIRSCSNGPTLLRVVKMVEPGFGYLAGNNGLILQYLEESESGVNEEAVDISSGTDLRVRQEGSRIVVSGLAGDGDVLVYDVLGRLLARARSSESPRAWVVIETDSFAPGPVYLVNEQSGRIRWNMVMR